MPHALFPIPYSLFSTLLFAASAVVAGMPTPAIAQITANPNDAGTVVNQNGNTINIEGGTQAGANLFHSFGDLRVNPGETANFISNPATQNILGRVTGGNASVINGIIQVTGGNSNLYLMNPAGIIFGAGASLNLPAAFTATTANGIGFGDRWFNAVGTNNYASLLGNPSGFAFTQAGTIFNAGNLAVGSGQNLTLLGGTVVSTGTISAPGGNITIAAIPGEQLVKITPEGSLLSLALPLETKAAINPPTLTPLTLPQLLTGGNVSGATGVTVENGVVKLTGANVTIPNTPGIAVVSNQVNASGATGGSVNVLGEKVALVGGNINASGTNGGGTVLIGGDYQGKGTVPNASQTFISGDSQINADAVEKGNGGRVIAWADGENRFYGNISARGGVTGGDGGFAEVSGKENLTFDGLVNLGATSGKNGLLLLDPANVRITTNAPRGRNQISGSDRFFFSPGQAQIQEGDLPSYTFYITPNRIVELLQNADISIAAQNNIQVNDKVDASGNSRISNLTLKANSIDVNDEIKLNTGSNLILTSTAPANSPTGGINLNLFGTLATDNGDITLNSRRPITLVYSLLTSEGGNITFNGPVEVDYYSLIATVNTTDRTDKPNTGNITFTSTIDSSSAEFPETLKIYPGGDVNIQGAIGSKHPLETLSIGGKVLANNVSLQEFQGDFLEIYAKGDVNIPGGVGNKHPLKYLYVGGSAYANNVSLKDFQGDILQIYAGGDFTLNTTGSLKTQAIIRSDGDIRLTATGDINLKDSNIISFRNDDSKGEVLLNSQTGNLTLENIFIEAPKDIKLQAQSINVGQTNDYYGTLDAGRDLIVQALANPSQLKIENAEIRAGRNLKLSAIQGDITLQNVLSSGDPIFKAGINLESQSLSIKNSQLGAKTDLNAQVQTDLTVENSTLWAYGNLTLQTQNNLNLKASEVKAGQNLVVQAQGKVSVEDTATKGAIALAGKDITIIGTQGIDIAVLNNPQSVFRSGANLNLISNGTVTGNGRFITGGKFAVLGDFRYTPVNANGIISATGDVSFGNYKGTSLKVEAGGSITGGDIEITGADTSLTGTDPDMPILASNPALILRAGLSELSQKPNVLPSETELRNSPNLSPEFTTSGLPSAKGIINIGNIKIATSNSGADAVILAALGDIKTGAITTGSGSVKLTSSGGKIIVDTINTRTSGTGGGGIDISSKGVFQATGSFDFRYQQPQGDALVFVTSPTSLLTRTGGIALDGDRFRGNITIRHGGASFVQNYDPGELPENASGTAGRILTANGGNASVISSYDERIIPPKPKPPEPTPPEPTPPEPTPPEPTPPEPTPPESDKPTDQRPLISKANNSACNTSTTVAVTPTGERTASPSATNASNSCKPATNNQKILQLLDETPNPSQNKELYFDSSYPRFPEFGEIAK